MKHAIAALIALPCLVPVVAPAGAGSIEDLVRANCRKQVLSSTDVDSSQFKQFTFAKVGNGYEMVGRDEHGATITCSAAEDGHVVWVHAR